MPSGTLPQTTMRTLAIILGSLIACTGLAARPRGARTADSSSGEYGVRDATIAPLTDESEFAGSTLIELDPNILAVTCERIKQAMLRELTMADVWRGRIYLQINSTL